MPAQTQRSAAPNVSHATVSSGGVVEANGADAATPPMRETIPPRPYPYSEEDLQRELDEKFAMYETLEPGWDLHSGDPANMDSLTEARKFLERRPKDVPLPFSQIGSDGFVGLYWRTDGAYACVGFEGDGLVSYYTKQILPGGSHRKSHGDGYPLDGGWPPKLLGVLRSLWPLARADSGMSG